MRDINTCLSTARELSRFPQFQSLADAGYAVIPKVVDSEKLKRLLGISRHLRSRCTDSMHAVPVQPRVLQTALSQSRCPSEILTSFVRVQQARVLIKSPGNSSATPLHQDAAYWGYSGALRFWLALTDFTQNSGCLKIIESSQKLGLLKHQTSIHRQFTLEVGTQSELQLNQAHSLLVPVSAGSLIVLDELLVHGAAPNRSSAPSIAIAWKLEGRRDRVGS